MSSKLKKVVINEIGPWITMTGCILSAIHASPIPAFISIFLSIVVDGIIRLSKSEVKEG